MTFDFRKFRWRLASMLFAVALWAGASAMGTGVSAMAASTSVSSSPADIVTGFHSVLITVMKSAEQLGYAGRFEKLTPHVNSTFHMRLMTQIASGKHWRKAAEPQKKALVEAFARVSIATYAARFDGFSGQQFKTLSTKDGPQQTQLVVTRLLNPGGDDVDLTYVIKQMDGKWRIIDIVLDTGISELAVRRSEYRQVLNRDGIDGLIAMLNGKAAQLGKS